MTRRQTYIAPRDRGDASPGMILAFLLAAVAAAALLSAVASIYWPLVVRR